MDALLERITVDDNDLGGQTQVGTRANSLSRSIDDRSF